MVKDEPTGFLNHSTVASMPPLTTTCQTFMLQLACVHAYMCAHSRFKTICFNETVILFSLQDRKAVGAALLFCDSAQEDECQDLGEGTDKQRELGQTGSSCPFLMVLDFKTDRNAPYLTGSFMGTILTSPSS